MEPVTTLLASTIAQLAFSEFTKSGANELAIKSVGGAMDLIGQLRSKIKNKFRKNQRAEVAIERIEQDGSLLDLEKLTKYLDLEMIEDENFATEIRQIAQQVINIRNSVDSHRSYTNYGRDQINIEAIEGSPKIGGS